MLERVLCSHLEQPPAPKTPTEIAPCYFEAILFPFHHLCRRRMVKCSSHLESWLSFTFTQCFTPHRLAALCVTRVDVLFVFFFFTSAVQMRRMGMTGTAPGSGGARKLNVAPSGAHGKSKAPTGHPVGLCASSMAEMGSIHPSPCLLWNLVQTFTSMVHSDHAGFWKGDGLHLQAANQARGCKPWCVSCCVAGNPSLLLEVPSQETMHLLRRGLILLHLLLCHEQYSLNISSVLLVLAFISPQKKSCLYQCTALTFLYRTLQKYWLFRIKWKRSRIAWINDLRRIYWNSLGQELTHLKIHLKISDCTRHIMILLNKNESIQENSTILLSTFRSCGTKVFYKHGMMFITTELDKIM